MIPQVGQYVKVIFRNGMQAEGTVAAWSDDKSVVNLPDNKSVCLIMNTKEDVLMVQMVNDISETKIGLREHMEELENQFHETYKEPSVNDLRLKKLAELKQMMIEQEKKIVKEKVVDHSITTVQGPKYGQPNFFKK